MKTAMFMTVIGLMGLFPLGTLTAADPPPTVEEVRELMEKQPLTAETWPTWRDYYVRLYYAYDVGEPKEFYERIGGFVGELASQNAGVLPGVWADDPVAWIALANHYRRSEPGFTERFEQASRKAVALGDPEGMSSLKLAGALVSVVREQSKTASLSPELRQKLDEAEERLGIVERAAPAARLSFVRGLILWHRGEHAAAWPLLRQGAVDHPKDSGPTTIYLSLWLGSKDASKPFAETTASFMKQFPDDATIQTFHSLALYRDERFLEAYEALQQARRQDEQATRFLGPKVLQAIEEGRWLTPLVLEGVKLTERKSYSDASEKFRQALKEEPQNIFAARLLARSLVGRANAGRMRADSPELGKMIDECAAVCQQFPQDAELQVTHGAALFRAGRHAEADAAMQRAKNLGGDLNKLAGPSGEAIIREAAHRDANERLLWWGLVGGVAAFTAWLPIMFLMGVLLALGTSRTPDPNVEFHGGISSKELWLGRFYMVVLSLSLLMFYLSVPFVVLGLLAVTLVLFGLMLVVRIIHFGILYRGFFAVWGLLRSAFIGPSRSVLGLVASEEQHPQLIATLHEVADCLETSPVETIYLTPTSQICVREEGRGPFGLFRRRRVMEIGISTLSLLTTSEFKSVLAHEYGHFTHHDPFYTRFISQVTASLAHALAVLDAAAGAVKYVNPFYWFYWLYLRAYALLAAGFSRSHEFLADRRAVLAYGRESFVSGLTKVCVDGALFDGTSIQNIKSELGAGRAFVNVFETYRQFRDRPEQAESQQQLLTNLREAKPSWFDTHPTLSERLAAVEGFPESRESLDTSPATSLLSDFTRLEEQLTELLTSFIYQNCEIADLPDWLRNTESAPQT